MVVPPQLIGQTLSHYRIIEQIGAGGMGVVYRARDEQLERDVAVKVLPIGTLADESARKRFRKEALALAKLNHPSIATIFEFSTQNDTDYLVTEYISGLSLDNKLAAGALSEKEVMGLGIQLAQGLGAAHEQGIVHRDLKPANLRLTSDERLKILDFGLSQLMPHASDLGLTVTMTKSQGVTGTLPYMAPEQLRGGTADARSDIWSAGAVLYEIATGQRPFDEKVAGALMDDIIHKAPSSPRTVKSEVSPKLEAVILKCLEKEPTKRYQSARELQADLERLSAGASPLAGRRRLWPIVAATAVVVALSAAGGYFYRHARPMLTDKDTIVLADDTNTTGDAVFDETLKQGLAVALEQSPFLNVLSDNKISETLRLMGRSSRERVTEEMAREICLRTGAQAFLGSSIASLGSHYVIGLKAINCQTQDSLGTTQAEAENRENVLHALGQAATAMRRKLGESLASVHKFDKPLEEATTSSLEALQAFSEGSKVADQVGEREALPFAKRAVELDANFALAYYGLGITYHNLGQAALAAENLKKAYDLRERVSQREKFSIAAMYYSLVTGEMEMANQQLEFLIHDYPRDSDAHSDLAGNYSILGQQEKALAEQRQTIDLDPDSTVSYSGLAGIYLALNRLDEAKTTVTQALQRKLDHPSLHREIYIIAFLQKDESAMQHEVAWAVGKPEAESQLLYDQSNTDAYYGRLRKSREWSQRAIDSAKRNDASESAASQQAVSALHESEFGNAIQARQASSAALASAPGRNVRLRVALALALADDAAQSRALVDNLDKEFPLDTLIQNYWLPTIRAQIEMNRGDVGHAEHAIQLLQTTSPYEIAWAYGMCQGCPVYVRGQAFLLAHQGREAAAEFQKILNHPGIVQNNPVGALAHLGLGRAYVLSGDTAKARAAFQDFLALWKDADPDIPILKEAKAEYAKLQ